jgi:hypothetical protein
MVTVTAPDSRTAPCAAPALFNGWSYAVTEITAEGDGAPTLLKVHSVDDPEAVQLGEPGVTFAETVVRPVRMTTALVAGEVYAGWIADAGVAAGIFMVSESEPGWVAGGNDCE